MITFVFFYTKNDTARTIGEAAILKGGLHPYPLVQATMTKGSHTGFVVLEGMKGEWPPWASAHLSCAPCRSALAP